MTTMREKAKINAEKNLVKYQELLKVLERSELPDKDERIFQCKHAIKKQEQILENIERY